MERLVDVGVVEESDSDITKSKIWVAYGQSVILYQISAI
jgi:hypothetical protein